MSTKPLLPMLLAGVMAFPTLFIELNTADAQQILTRQKIVNGLTQRRNAQPRKRVHRQNHRVQKRVVRRRAPQKQVPVMRVPQKQFRAPEKVAKRRTPPQQLRAPRAPQKRSRVPQRTTNKRPPTQQFRVPPRAQEGRTPNRVVKRRAPNRVVERRAPQRNNNQQFRAPAQNQNTLRNRTPERIPQQFDQQVASNNPNDVNQRAINVEAAVTQQMNAASVDLEILFDYNSDRIEPGSVKQLLILAEALQDPALINSRILVGGHTDAKGSREYNQDLSYRRARSVVDFLIDFAGIAPDRLAIEGYGEDLLKYPDAPNSGQNRRVEIINMGS